MSDVPSLISRFTVGITAHNITTGQTRIVRQINPIEGGEGMLLVRANEDDENSVLWTWRAESCDALAKPVTYDVDDYVILGSGTVVRQVKDVRVHDKTKELQYRVDVDDEKEKWVYAIALHPVAAPVAYDLKATDESTPSDSAQVAALDDMPLSSENIPSADDKLIDYWSALAGREARRADDAEERIKDVEERAKVAELNNTKLLEQINKLEAVIVKPVAAPSTCYEIKIVKLQADLPESEKRWQDLLSDGWKENNISSVIDSRDIVWQIVTFKKLVEFVPQPERSTAGAHAQLTGDFVWQQHSPFRSTREVQPTEIIIEGVDEPRKVGPIEQSIKENGVEETSRIMTSFALQQAIMNARQRIDNMPVFNSPLHTLKASN